MKKTACIAIAFFSVSCYLPVQAQTKADAHAMLAAASKQFKALPKTFSIEVPPRIEMKCGRLTDEQWLQINDYAAKFQDPEAKIAKKNAYCWQNIGTAK